MNIYKWAVLILIVMITGFLTPKAEAQSADVNFSLFHDRLSIYGTWVASPRYGQVWMYDEPGFKPYYTNGRWDYTDYGWSWVSDYDWGWAPFHYGRWEFDDYYNNWIWIPGYEWAPAWVAWSEADDYYGWAPLGFGVNINVSFGAIRQDRWIFAPRQYINSPRVRDYCLPSSRNRVIIQNNITIINNRGRADRYMRGPERRDVERYTRTRVEERRITDNDRFGRRDVARNNDRGRNSDFPRDNRTGSRPDNNRVGDQQRSNDNDRWNRNGNRRGDQGMENRDFDRDRRNTNNRTGRADNGNYNNRTESRPERTGTRPDPSPADRPRENGTTNNRPDIGNRPSGNGGWGRGDRQQNNEQRESSFPGTQQAPRRDQPEPTRRTEQPSSGGRSFDNRGSGDNRQQRPADTGERGSRRRG